LQTLTIMSILPAEVEIENGRRTAAVSLTKLLQPALDEYQTQLLTINSSQDDLLTKLQHLQDYISKLQSSAPKSADGAGKFAADTARVQQLQSRLAAVRGSLDQSGKRIEHVTGICQLLDAAQ
jgi:chaperonin cofactor prefoldin